MLTSVDAQCCFWNNSIPDSNKSNETERSLQQKKLSSQHTLRLEKDLINTWGVSQPKACYWQFITNVTKEREVYMAHDSKMSISWWHNFLESLLEYGVLWLPANRNNGTAFLNLLSYIKLHHTNMLFSSFFFFSFFPFLYHLFTDNKPDAA